MANDKRFVAKNGLQAQNINFVSPNGSQSLLVQLGDNDLLTVAGAVDITGNTDVTGSLDVTGNVSGSVFTGTRYTSTVATGTAPLTVSSTTRVANLNVARSGIADAWTTARTLSLTGAVTGSVSINGSGNVSLATTATSDPTLTLSGDASGTATFTNLGDATLSVSVSQAGNAGTLDNLDSTQFLRSDTADTMSGKLTISQNPPSTVTYSNGHMELNSSDGSIVSMGFHRTGFTACQLRHENNGLILSGTSQTNAANLSVTGTVSAPTFSGSLSGNATTASAWQTARTLSLTGAVTGSVSIDGSGNVSLATTATSDPTLTLSGDATGTATFTNLGNATLSVSVSQAGNANTLDSLDSTAFLRSNTDDTATGTLTLNGTNGIAVRAGVDGGYGTSNGTGTAWGTPVWSMGSAYSGTGSGTTFAVDANQYGLTWLRDGQTSVTATIVSEGLYVWRAGTKIAGFGYNGHWFSGNVRATGDVIAFYSDERLKDFHGKIDSAVDKISSLSGYYYTENELAKSLGYDNDNMQLGVSAQEVQKVFPEAVAIAAISYKDGVDEEYLTVKYEKLVPALIEAVKEQQTQINSQQQQIDELTAKVDALIAASSK